MSQVKQLFGVLLKSAHGYKKEIKDGDHMKPVPVHKGSLLVYLDSVIANEIQKKHDRLVNYKLADRHDIQRFEVFLFDSGSSILHVNPLQREFLLGVRQTHYRMEILDKLQWVESLTVGSEVYVTIATIPTPVKGIIRYIGGLPGEEGRKFGIELMEHRGEGTQNGEFKGHKYFKCDKDCAVFVAMDKITDHYVAEAAKVTVTPDTCLPRQLAPIKIDDFVTFCDKNDILYRGVAKWIGTVKSSYDIVVGIEVDGSISIVDFPHHINIEEDMEYFSSDKSKVFLPITHVKLDTTRSSDAQSDNTESHSENVHIPAKAGDGSNPYNFVVGSAVQYLYTGQYGVIKWIGTLERSKVTFAGVEMEDYVDGFAGSDGSWGQVKYFTCEPNRGKLVILSSLRPDQRIKQDVLPEISSQSNGQSNKSNNTVEEAKLAGSSAQPVGANPYNLEVGSVVQYESQYGVIKWIGNLPDHTGTHAGLEMDADIKEDCNDGIWIGVKYYDCKPKRGIFVSLSALKPSERTMTDESSDKVSTELNTTNYEFHVDPLQNPCNLTVGSAVKYGRPTECGVIKWIGNLPDDKKTVYAGLVMDEDIVRKAHDGVWKGVRYYDCDKNRGYFVPLKNLKPCTEGKRKRSADDILLKHAERNLTEHHSLVNIGYHSLTPRQPSTDYDIRFQNPHKFGVGSTVQFGEPAEYGVIKWLGLLPGRQNISYAGVETEEITDNYSNGMFDGVQYFKPRAGRGKFVKLQLLRPDKRFIDFTAPCTSLRGFKVGSRVQFGSQHRTYGVITWIGTISDEEYVKVQTEDGKESGLIPIEKIKLDCKYDDSCKSQNESVLANSSSTLQQTQSTPILLEVESVVEFGDPVQYGTIKRIEEDSILNKEVALIETEYDKCIKVPLDEVKPDNRFNNDLDTKNSQHISNKLETGSLVQFGDPLQYGVIKKIFTPADTLVETAEVETESNQLKKIPLAELQPDNRFAVDVNNIEGNVNPLEKEFYKHDETLYPVPPANKFDAGKHVDIKGIQGYKNSCYLDSTLYGMFMFSDAFDILILEDITTSAEELDLQKRLKSKIVYPLRKKGIVVQESVEEFREHLANLQNMKGLTSEEKDPEEFLNLLFKHVFHLDPFITIRRPSGIDKEFFVQLFVEPDKDEPAVNTQRLLSKMFQEQNITFAEYPTRLLLQMPRYGKKFKSFQRIVPSLELNVTSLCTTGGLCSICKTRMGNVCSDCSKQKNQIQCYCNTCSPRWHQIYYYGKNHELNNSDYDTGTLQLLSVLCIETSHYVCFTRITGSGKDEWVFFDSMAERQDNGYNLPRVTHCTYYFQEFVYGKKDIGRIPSKDLPELVRRFVEDAYLCIYVDHDGVMYQ